MRTQLLGRLSLLLAGVACLCGAGTARAQYPYWNAGYPHGGNGYGNTPYAPGGRGYAPYGPNPYSFTNASPGAAANGYPDGASGFAAHGDSGGSFVPVAPLVPLGPDGLPPADDDDGHKDKDRGRVAGCAKDCFWFSAGYESAWIKPGRVSTPLVTQGSVTDLHPGALGEPGTTILFGNSLDFDRFDGVRLGLGVSLDGGEHVFVEAIGFYLFPQHVNETFSSDATGNPIITRPFFNANENTERAFFTSNPGIASGSSSVDARSELLGAELNLRLAARPSDCVRYDLLGGFRFLRLNESLTMRDQLTALEPGVFSFLRDPVAQGDIVTDADSFRTVNHFYGLQLGGSATWEGKWLFATAFGKAALGVTDQQVNINGASALLTGGGPFVAGGGILALPSNIGNYNRTVLGFVPEGGITGGVKITPHLRLTCGYSFMWWNSVVRPGAQIDRGINPTLVPTDNSFGTLTGPVRPAFHFNNESFWVHTLTVGLDLHY